MRSCLDRLEFRHKVHFQFTLQYYFSAGSIIVLEVCGEDSGRVCRQVLEVGASTDSVYLSSGPMQGLLDSQALSKVMEISLTM